MSTTHPRWLRWLGVGPDLWQERGGPSRPKRDPLARITDEDIDAAMVKFLDSFRRAARPIDKVRTREFIKALPSPAPAESDDVPAWYPTSHGTEQS
jgi:hypothetical protein